MIPKASHVPARDNASRMKVFDGFAPPQKNSQPGDLHRKIRLLAPQNNFISRFCSHGISSSYLLA